MGEKPLVALSPRKGDASRDVRPHDAPRRKTTLNAEHRELMRRLTLNDEEALSEVMSGRTPGAETLLDDRTRALVRIAALVALDSKTASFQVAWDAAWAAGANDEEILETVVAVAPLVGATRVASALPRLAAALNSR